MEVMFIVVALVVAVVTLWDAVRDPRKVRIGVGIVIAVALTLTQLFGQTVTALENMDDTAQRASVFILAVALVTLLGIVAFGAMLVFNGLEVLRRERHSLANALSLIIGVLILVYVVITVVTVFSSNVQTFLLMVLVGFPTGYLGLGLVAYVVWASAYTAWMRRRGIPVAAVIVLGAGLSGGRTVTPLLAARVDAAIDWIRARPAPEDTAPWLVCSGGQGPDEQVSEAQAMAEYAESRGVPRERIPLEDHSRNTRENIRFSQRLLATHDCAGPVAVATSSYHAFRAALLMRAARMPGYAIGARTARYYWPSAMIREYLAVLRDHRILNAVLLAVLCVPLALWALIALNILG